MYYNILRYLISRLIVYAE